jgi:hypothetical protein
LDTSPQYTLEELVHAVANPGFEELCKLCPGAARCKARKPTAACCKAASGFSVWRCFWGAVPHLDWFAQIPLYILPNQMRLLQ